jgi:hypothetical protein
MGINQVRQDGRKGFGWLYVLFVGKAPPFQEVISDDPAPKDAVGYFEVGNKIVLGKTTGAARAWG